jgi:hypothetical protein
MKSGLVIEKLKELINLEEEYSLSSLQNILKHSYYICLNSESMEQPQTDNSMNKFFSKSI